MTTRLLAALALLALPLVACSSEEAPTQQDGYVKVEKVVTADEAARIKKLYEENPFSCPRDHSLCELTPLGDGKVLVQQSCMVDDATCCY